MAERSANVMMWRSVAMLAVLLTLAAGSIRGARAQETALKHAPRAEMIDAIMSYAGSGGCETLRNVFGTAFDEACSRPGSGTAVYITAFMALLSQPDQALFEICTRNKLVDCEARQETSTGKPILTFATSFSMRASPETGAWSPDGRLLLIYAIGQHKGQTRLIDVERLSLGPVISEGSQPIGVAWSPDGKHLAIDGAPVGGPIAIRLYATDTFEEKGSLAAAQQNECGFATSTQIAFTPDSQNLWVSCGGSSGAYGSRAIAIKLRVPKLEIEDRLLPEPLTPGKQFTFRTYAISSVNDDLALTGISRPVGPWPPGSKQQMALQSFSLRTKAPLHTPLLMNLFYGDRDTGSYLGVRSAFRLHVLQGASAVLLHFPGAGSSSSAGTFTYPEAVELWSTDGRGRLDVGPSITMSERYLPPSRLGGSGLHLKVRHIANSSRRTLTVIDGKSGNVAQELGPIPPVEMTLVSPDGSRVATIGRHDIRIYRVDLDEAAAAATQGP